MKKLAIVIFISSLILGCSSAQETALNQKLPPQAKKDETLVAAHTTENQKPAAPANTATKPADNTAGPAGGSPMQKGIDVSEMTANIEKAEKAYKANQKDEKAKDALAAAYFERAFALTEAAQYRAAIGDFRKGLKLKPDATEAKAMYDQTIGIFKSMGREPPKEGEEPAPLPFEGKK